MIDYHIGHTPLVELPCIHGNRIFLKLEKENFLGSIKARSAYWIIRDLPDAADRIIIESTSGNLGFALGFFCKEAGLEFVALMDTTAPRAKLERFEKAGICYRLVEAEEGFDYRTSRIRLAQRMMDSDNYYWVNQYDNPSNIKAHELTTGPEIWEQTKGSVTHIICPMGSCGTICGLGRYFKRRAPSVQICGVEPFGSTIYGDHSGDYYNVGAGLAGKPGNLLRNPGTVDCALSVSDSDSIGYAQYLIKECGLGVGVTSGMAYCQAAALAQQLKGAVIVVIAPDGSEAYSEYLS